MISLNYKKFGQGPPLIFLHGLYGWGTNWQSIANQLQDKFSIYLVDQRNHGQSPHLSTMDYKSMANDLEEFIDQKQLTEINLVGHSMGGKVAMNFTLENPELVTKLVVVDISPRVYSSDPEYSTEAQFHYTVIETLRNLDVNSIKTRQEADQSIRHKIYDPFIRSFLLSNLKRSTNKSFRWQLNLEAIKNNMDQIMGWESPMEINPRKIPSTLFIRGDKSSYILETDYKIIPVFFPDADIATIKGAGHMVHVQAPEQFLNVLKKFLLN